MSVMVIANFQAAEGKAEALLPLLQHGRDIQPDGRRMRSVRPLSTSG